MSWKDLLRQKIDENADVEQSEYDKINENQDSKKDLGCRFYKPNKPMSLKDIAKGIAKLQEHNNENEKSMKSF